jgi:streptogramin lyase
VPGAARRRPRRAALFAAALALVAGAVLAAVLATGGSKSPTGRGPGPVQQIAVGTDPLELAADPGGIWVANHGSDSVARIAPVTGALLGKAVAAVAQPLGVAVNEGLVWVVGPDGEIASLDARTGRRLSSVSLRRQVDGIAAGFGAVWTFNGTAGTVTRSDVRNGRLGPHRTVKVGVGTSDIVAGPGGVWVANSASATLVQLVPGTGAIARTVRLRHAIGGVALDGGAVWTSSPTEGRIIRVGTDSRVAQTFSVGPAVPAADVAAGDGAVFYIDRGDGSVTRVDPATGNRVGARVRLVKQPGAAVVSAHALWVTDRASGTVARLGF